MKLPDCDNDPDSSVNLPNLDATCPFGRLAAVGAGFAPILTKRRTKELSIPQTTHDHKVAISMMLRKTLFSNHACQTIAKRLPITRHPQISCRYSLRLPVQKCSLSLVSYLAGTRGPEALVSPAPPARNLQPGKPDLLKCRLSFTGDFVREAILRLVILNAGDPFLAPQAPQIIQLSRTDTTAKKRSDSEIESGRSLNRSWVE